MTNILNLTSDVAAIHNHLGNIQTELGYTGNNFNSLENRVDEMEVTINHTNQILGMMTAVMSPTFHQSGDLQVTPDMAYKMIYDFYYTAYPEQAAEFDTLLRVYGYNYRKAVLAMETNFNEE